MSAERDAKIKRIHELGKKLIKELEGEPDIGLGAAAYAAGVLVGRQANDMDSLIGGVELISQLMGAEAGQAFRKKWAH